MNTPLLKRTLVPLITIALFILLYVTGNFQMISAAILVIIASAVEYRKQLFTALGFQRKRFRALDLLVIAPLVALGLFLFYVFILLPSVTAITDAPIDLSAFDEVKGDLAAIITLILFVWVSAAFGEEILFRGFFMRQFKKFFGSSTISIILNIVLIGILFGWVHSYQGITGQIVAGITGMLLAIIFHLRKDDLWFNVAVHGFFDTIAVLVLYNGWL